MEKGARKRVELVPGEVEASKLPSGNLVDKARTQVKGRL